MCLFRDIEEGGDVGRVEFLTSHLDVVPCSASVSLFDFLPVSLPPHP